MKTYKGGFRDLVAWKESREFRIMISKLAEKFPREEKYSLTTQIKRSSRSITANIAEGYGRYHFQETMQFFRHSRGSLSETLDHLITALDEKYISTNEFEEAELKLSTVMKLINGYLVYLEKSKNKTQEITQT
jgi:four helix bundle protein